MMNTPHRVDESFRPRLHFSPPSGWLNDPNGLVYSGGLWHLHYQYQPHSMSPGAMHWGRAVSRDLLRWQDKPPALLPDALGSIFSGSVIKDVDNRSGLFDGAGDCRLMAFYTASGRCHQRHRTVENQCLATSRNGGDTWSKYPGNPILPTREFDCFRDPTVLWCQPSQCWLMLLTHGRSLGFYRSNDAISWRHLSEFSAPGHNWQNNAVWECPDLLLLRTDDGAEKWLLSVGINDGGVGGGSATQCFVGDFDGVHFTVDDRQRVNWLDHGRDFYALQAWRHAPSDKPVVIAWMSNWQYAAQTPTQHFRGVMTMPRELSLARHNGGYVVVQSYPDSLDKALSCQQPSAVDSRGRLSPDSDVYRVRARLDLRPGQSASLRLFGTTEPQYVFERRDGFLSLTARRTGEGIVANNFAHRYDSVLPLAASTVTVDLLVDRGCCELLVGDGRLALTHLYYPTQPDAPVQLGGSGWGEARIHAIELGELA